MYKTISSKRVLRSLKSTAEFRFYSSGFTNAVLEYFFSRPRFERGILEHIAAFKETETEKGLIDRVALVHVIKNEKKYFFYVFVEKDMARQQTWNAVAWSNMMQGKIRTPDYETEMNWFWHI